MIPNLVVIDPCDATEIEQVTRAVAEHEGPTYTRLLRGAVTRVLDPVSHRFEIGPSYVPHEGNGMGLIATGLMTERALEAAGELGAGIPHVPTIKPFDAVGVVAFASRYDRLITLENHVTSGGLGSLVAEALFEAGFVRPMRRVGIPDQFIECGSLPYLQEKCGMTTPRIVALAHDESEWRKSC